MDLQTPSQLSLSSSPSTLLEKADTLEMEAELVLLKGDLPLALELFDKATLIDEQNARLYFRQGLCLFEYGTENTTEKALFLACKKFKKATLLDPCYFEAYQAWGNALAFIGESQKEIHYFVEAEGKYKTAIALCDFSEKEVAADLFWDYGVVWLHLSENSQEALDLRYALQAFEKAQTFHYKLPHEYWIDYGTASLKLSEKINDIKLHVKAIHCFKHAISMNHNSFNGWASLADALSLFYAHSHDEEHFNQANEAFATAANLCGHENEIWSKWAEFLCHSSRKHQDIKKLRAAIEKCHRVYAHDPKDAKILAIWAECLARLGELNDRLDLLNEAQNKICEALDISEDDPDVWYSYGMCLHSFASYYNDFDYYYQAIEKFQEGISIDRTHHQLWHSIASSYSQVGVVELDTEALEKSLKFFQKAIALSPFNSYYLFDYGFALYKLGELTQQQQRLHEAVFYIEQAVNTQKNAIYLHPEWLFHYASTLDLLGDFHEEEYYYTRAIEIFSHVLMIDPEFSRIHHRLAQTFSHLGELIYDVDHFYRALHHLRLATKRDEEDDQIILDWGLTLINIAQHAVDYTDIDSIYREAEAKLLHAAKLGNLQAYYHLGCLYSILRYYDKALHFVQKADQYKALPPMEEILQDDWLDGLRSTVDFREFLAQLETRRNLHEER